MVKYIHYGSSKFNPERFDKTITIPSTFLSKPYGGLWASRVGAKYGWKDWCIDESFNTEKLEKHFEFYLSDDANVLEIHSHDDVKKMPEFILPERKNSRFVPDFSEMIKRGVDAIELFLFDDARLDHDLYGWDCDSVLIMNPEIIVTEEGCD